MAGPRRIEADLASAKVAVFAPFLSNRLYFAGTAIEVFVVGGTQEEAVRAIASYQSKLYAEADEPRADGAAGGVGRRAVEVDGTRVEVDGTRVVLHAVQSSWEDFIQGVQESIRYIPEFRFLFTASAWLVRQRGLDVPTMLLAGILATFCFERRKQRPRTLGESLLKFLEYFGVGPLRERRVNYAGCNRYEVVQEPAQAAAFSLWVSADTNLACPAVKDLFSLFKNRYRLLTNLNFAHEASILSWLVNPCFGPFHKFLEALC